MVKRKGLKAGNRKFQHDDQKVDLKAPSYKWLLCRKCEFHEVKVSIETVACICSICMTIACDHMPRVIDAPKKSEKPLKVVNTFENNRAKEEKEANLAAIFKNKKSAIKDGSEPKKKTRKKRVTKKKTRKKRVTKNKSKKRTK